MADSGSAGHRSGDKRSLAADGSTRNGGNTSYNAGMAVFSYIVGGIAVWSLIGWGLDVLFKTHWIVLIGALAGLAGGLYLSFAPRFRHEGLKDEADSGSGA